jgi:hypothetical protein
MAKWVPTLRLWARSHSAPWVWPTAVAPVTTTSHTMQACLTPKQWSVIKTNPKTDGTHALVLSARPRARTPCGKDNDLERLTRRRSVECFSSAHRAPDMGCMRGGATRTSLSPFTEF